jgi:hypothetical protein
MGFKFNEVYQKARADQYSLSWRWSNAKRCIYKHARLINQSFQGTLARLCQINSIEPGWILGITPAPAASPELLNQMLLSVKGERDRFMEKYTNYRVQRNFDKQIGRLKMPSQYLRNLYAPDYYDARCILLAPWREKDKYGFIDKTGSYAIQPMFDSAEPFVDGKALVKKEKQSFSIDPAGMRVD